MKTPHTGTNRGKRVTVILRNGQRICDRFVERRDDCIILQTYGRIRKKSIRAFIIDKRATECRN